MKYDYSNLGLSEAELFSVTDHSDLESEKITAPRYSYWQSVFRVFFRKKLNIVILGLLVVVVLFAYIYPSLTEYDRFGNLMNAEAKHLTPGAAMELFGRELKWILGAGANGQSTFDAIWDGDLQEDNAGIVRQLKNLEDQIALGGETMYMAILAMESQEDGLERQLAALDRQLEELRLRHKLGQISTLTLTEAEAGRASLASGLETLRMNIRVYKAQLETLLGAEQTGSIQLGGVPQVTAKQLSDMDLEAGLASAKEASYELFDAKRTLKGTQDAYHGIGDYTPTLNAEHGWPAAKYTYNNTVQNYEMKFRTLYAQVKDYKQILEASKVSASSKEASYAAAELKYRQGNNTKNTLLTAEDELTAAKEAVRSAENDLFTAYNNYCWAVKTGILN